MEDSSIGFRSLTGIHRPRRCVRRVDRRSGIFERQSDEIVIGAVQVVRVGGKRPSGFCNGGSRFDDVGSNEDSAPRRSGKDCPHSGMNLRLSIGSRFTDVVS